ncbi:phosphate ABC transporter substrate-binding protein PstS [Gemmatimonas sp.]|uniref:phosphate ABC transporter substrate-binding protein PstS n=1 Tax=Gemmatimonas sp. TaxID=1962908 RepID=UPI00356324CE
MTRSPRAASGSQNHPPQLRRALSFALLLLSACSPAAPPLDVASDRAAAAPGVRVDLTGAGATFPYPLYARWFNEYAALTNVRINYQSIGSGGGIRQLVARTIDFGATDVPMTDEELASAGMPVLHIPTVIGAVAITYNLPRLARPLNLSPDVIADIFLGTVTRWSDPRIALANPKLTLPDTDILVVHRADGSGTSYIFSDFLTTVSPAWAAGPGRGKDVRWPVGIGGKGNEGVAGQVKQMPGAIGYLEVVYARQNRLPVVHVRNAAGRFISPMPFEIASAATAVLEADRKLGASDGNGTPDLRVSLVNAPGAQSYPIASFTWMLIAPSAIGGEKSRRLAAFIRWALLDNPDVASTLGYVPLPSEAASRIVDRLDAALAGGRPGLP